MTTRTTAWKRLMQLLQAERQEVRSIYTFGIFQGLVGLSLPLGIQAIITFLQAGQLSTSWYMLVAFVLGGILIGGYLQLKQLTVTETIEQRLFVNTAFHFADRLPRLSLKDLDHRYMPETLNRFFEIVTIQKGISKMLIDFSAAIIQVLFGVIILTLYHPTFLILAALITVIITAFFKYSGPKGLSTSMQESKYKYKVAYWLQEVGRTLRSFKLAGDSTLPVERTNALTVSYLQSRNAHFQVLMRQYRVLILFKLMLAGMLIVLGSVLVVNNLINIGQFVAAEIIILLLINSIEKIILNMSTVYDVLTSLDKLGNALDLTLERSSGTPLQDNESNALMLEVRDLQFQFPDAQKPLLSGVQLQVMPGETICIQGDDGSGKTTLIRLLSGYYDDFSGTIAYNQLSIKAIELQSLRAHIGENFSENEIFAGTILDNISCGRPSIDTKTTMEALHKVDLKNWFIQQPQGLATLLTPEGQGLPGHIRRRLMLARIFAGKPRMLLIEDSPMMQSPNERELFYQLLFAHCKDITTIVISNDPSIASRCMQTYVLQNGQLTPKTTLS
jgi:ABC-type bacteriocin/lantibiotic exporter with double-glycine peptidase domain